MELKQRKDPFYFLIAICTAIFVYFLFYNFSDNPIVIAESAQLEDLKQPLLLIKADPIRKISESKRQVDQKNPRMPASASAESDAD